MRAYLEALLAPWRGLPPNLRGILWITFGSVAFALNDVLIKTLGRSIDALELALFRYSVGVILLSPLFWRAGIAGLKTRRLGLHATRLVIASIAQIGTLVSVINLPLASATSLSFSRIVFTTIVAIVLLREAVTRQRWWATGLGFVGVIVMLRPSPEGVDPIAAVAVGAAMSFAVANVMIKMLSGTEPAVRILFYYHIGGVLVFLVPAILVWRSPVGIEWPMAAGIGLLTTLGMIAFVRGFAVGEASVIGPMEYTRLVYAAILGLLIFSEIPDLWTVLGAAIIIASTTYLARVEARAARRPRGDRASSRPPDSRH